MPSTYSVLFLFCFILFCFLLVSERDDIFWIALSSKHYWLMHHISALSLLSDNFIVYS